MKKISLLEYIIAIVLILFICIFNAGIYTFCSSKYGICRCNRFTGKVTYVLYADMYNASHPKDKTLEDIYGTEQPKASALDKMYGVDPELAKIVAEEIEGKPRDYYAEEIEGKPRDYYAEEVEGKKRGK